MAKVSAFIGAAEAAERLKVSRRTVVNLINSGLLPAEKIGNAYIIRLADLARVPGDRKPGPKPATLKREATFGDEVVRSFKHFMKSAKRRRMRPKPTR
jgi:excisionase family DNA binding protein